MKLTYMLIILCPKDFFCFISERSEKEKDTRLGKEKDNEEEGKSFQIFDGNRFRSLTKVVVETQNLEIPVSHDPLVDLM